VVVGWIVHGTVLARDDDGGEEDTTNTNDDDVDARFDVEVVVDIPG